MGRLYAGESIAHVVLVTGHSRRRRRLALRPRHRQRLAPALAGRRSRRLLLGAAARFIHFALFQGDLLSAASYGCDT